MVCVLPVGPGLEGFKKDIGGVGLGAAPTFNILQEGIGEAHAAREGRNRSHTPSEPVPVM